MPPLRTATRFLFDQYTLISEENAIVFEYVMEYPDHPAERFREVLTIPWVTAARWKTVPKKLLDRTLQTLHLALGVSYWKMYCPPELVIKPGAWTSVQLDFWKGVYTQGMGEFYYKNQIDFRDLVHIRAETLVDEVLPIVRVQKPRCLVPIGGGKDSAVTAQLLQECKIPFDTFTMGSSPIQEAFIEALGASWKRIDRQLDPLMIARGKAKEVYNGHVPVSLIYFFTSLLAAVLGDYRYVVFSNEKSANMGNVKYLGMEVNHQWSKSLECEQQVRRYLATYVTPGIEIFSLLRPLHEIEIARRFFAYGNYFSLISSCNRNFVVSSQPPKAERGAYWCGACPKCAFVFAIFAAFLPKTELCEMFGKDLFADEVLLPLYQELLGLKGMKPFECVGLPEEVLVAFADAHTRDAWNEDVVMRWVVDQGLLEPSVIEGMKKELFAIGSLETLPEHFKKCFA